jgi:hypothetical protein
VVDIEHGDAASGASPIMRMFLITSVLLPNFLISMLSPAQGQPVEPEEVRAAYRESYPQLVSNILNRRIRGNLTITTRPPEGLHERKYAFDIAVGSGQTLDQGFPPRVKAEITWLPDSVPDHYKWYQNVNIRNITNFFRIERKTEHSNWYVVRSGSDFNTLEMDYTSLPMIGFVGFTLPRIHEIMLGSRHRIDDARLIDMDGERLLRVAWSRRPDAPSENRTNGVDIEDTSGWFLLDPSSFHATRELECRKGPSDRKTVLIRYKPTKKTAASWIEPMNITAKYYYDNSTEEYTTYRIDFDEFQPHSWSDRDFSLEPYGLAALNQPPAQSTFNPFTWIFLAAALAFLALALWLRKRNAHATA